MCLYVPRESCPRAYPLGPPSAFSLDFLGFGVYTFPPGAAGAMSFHDPLEGTETSLSFTCRQIHILYLLRLFRRELQFGHKHYLPPTKGPHSRPYRDNSCYENDVTASFKCRR